MKADDLFRTLAADTLRPHSLMTVLMPGLIPSLVLAVAVVWLAVGFRADLAPFVLQPVSSIRIVPGAVLGIAAFGLRW